MQNLCVFIHYSNGNIHENTILEILKQPLFMAYHNNQPFNDNMLRPCPMLENPEILQRIVKEVVHIQQICSLRRQQNIFAVSVFIMPRSGLRLQINCGLRSIKSKL